MKHLAAKIALLTCLVFFIPVNQVFAWNALGHMVVANIAYQHLQPNVREKVDRLVGEIQKEYPNLTTFQHLAVWADSLRAQKIETFTHWHYIDIPISLDGAQTKDVVDTDNAVWAVNQIEVVVKNEKANPTERARFLAFLTHIVSDLHQPLHTVTAFSKNHTEGDQGGNLYMVRYNHERIKMHKLWDSGLGAFDGDSIISQSDSVMQNIRNLYPEAYFGDKVKELTPEAWVIEGMDNAKLYVYSAPEDRDLTVEYISTGKQIAEKQVALAGYRLAALLNQLLA